MKCALTILATLFIFACFGQDIIIHESEKNREYVEECLKKASHETTSDSIYYYLNKASIISENINYHEGEISACTALIEYHENDRSIYDRLRYSLLLVRLNKQYGERSEQADALGELAKLYFNEKLYQKAVEAFQEATDIKRLDQEQRFDLSIGLIRSLLSNDEASDALSVAHDLEFSKKLSTYQRVELQKEKAKIYHSLNAYSEEQSAYKKILELVENTQYQYLEPIIWNNMGYAQKYTGNFDDAKKSFQMSISKSRGNKEMLAASNFNLGLIYHNDGALDSAIILFSLAEKYYLALNMYEDLANTLNMQAITYYNGADQFNAQKFLDRAFIVEKEHNLKRQEARSHEIQSLVQTSLYEDRLALESYKKYLAIRESLRTDERFAEARLYEAERIEKQLRTIWTRQEIERVNQAKELAERDAEADRSIAREKEVELQFAELQNRDLVAQQELQRLKLKEQRSQVENQERELTLIQKENRVKELALQTERLLLSEKEQENTLLAQRNELEKQRRLNGEQVFRNRLQLGLGILLLFIFIILAILIAYRQLRKRKKKIEEQNAIIAASKKEIEKEKEKSERLLLNILPAAIADELKANGTAKPKSYNEVSVGFTDFSGFTMISEQLSPEELVQKLDEIFLGFDKIIEKFGLQRIKTIGDAYMFASGIPEEIDDHATLIVKAAIEMRDFIGNYNSKLSKSQLPWNIRIGLNTGPVVAGVIGIKKFAYDIWGDTVNTAARMESSGKSGKINISGSTYALIKNEFDTVHRGKIPAKNKGDVDMYFVEKRS